MGWPECEANTKRAPDWMKAGDAKPSVTPQIKRNVGPSILSKIAAQAPKKLRRSYANAEAILSERAQR
jgi:hypothetical protein